MWVRLLFGTVFIALLAIPFLADDRSNDGAPELAYRPAHLVAHSIARLKRNQCDLAHIKITGPRVFGLDRDNALVTANFDAIFKHAPNVPQIYALVLRTADGGRTWTQVLDPVRQRISRVTDVRFIGRRGLLLHEHSVGGQSVGFLYSQDFGETWLPSVRADGVMGSFALIGWSVRAPHNGVAVIRSAGGIQISQNSEREVAYWVIKTPNGFRWRIDRIVTDDQADSFDPNQALWPSDWGELDTAWSLGTTEARATVYRVTEDGEPRQVLSIPTGIVWRETAADQTQKCPSVDRSAQRY
ncbi:MAG: hypothetical protein AAGH76_10185 [Pseudomonadota bacterium]